MHQDGLGRRGWSALIGPMARDMEPLSPGPHLRQLVSHLAVCHRQHRHLGQPPQAEGQGHLLHVVGVGLEEQVEQVREVCEVEDEEMEKVEEEADVGIGAMTRRNR